MRLSTAVLSAVHAFNGDDYDGVGTTFAPPTTSTFDYSDRDGRNFASSTPALLPLDDIPTADVGADLPAPEARYLSQLLQMVKHYEYGHTTFAGQPIEPSTNELIKKRFNYGCNCYVSTGSSQMQKSYGSALNDYDNTCRQLIKCYETVQSRDQSCSNAGLDGPYQFSLSAKDATLAAADRSVTCSDAADSCERMTCECDAAFAKASAMEFEKLTGPLDQDQYNWYVFYYGQGYTDIRTSAVCDGVDLNDVNLKSLADQYYNGFDSGIPQDLHDEFTAKIDNSVFFESESEALNYFRDIVDEITADCKSEACSVMAKWAYVTPAFYGFIAGVAYKYQSGESTEVTARLFANDFDAIEANQQYFPESYAKFVENKRATLLRGYLFDFAFQLDLMPFLRWAIDNINEEDIVNMDVRISDATFTHFAVTKALQFNEVTEENYEAEYKAYTDLILSVDGGIESKVKWALLDVLDIGKSAPGHEERVGTILNAQVDIWTQSVNWVGDALNIEEIDWETEIRWAFVKASMLRVYETDDYFNDPIYFDIFALPENSVAGAAKFCEEAGQVLFPVDTHDVRAEILHARLKEVIQKRRFVKECGLIMPYERVEGAESNVFYNIHTGSTECNRLSWITLDSDEMMDMTMFAACANDNGKSDKFDQATQAVCRGDDEKDTYKVDFANVLASYSSYYQNIYGRELTEIFQGTLIRKFYDNQEYQVFDTEQAFHSFFQNKIFELMTQSNDDWYGRWAFESEFFIKLSAALATSTFVQDESVYESIFDAPISGGMKYVAISEYLPWFTDRLSQKKSSMILKSYLFDFLWSAGYLDCYASEEKCELGRLIHGGVLDANIDDAPRGDDISYNSLVYLIDTVTWPWNYGIRDDNATAYELVNAAREYSINGNPGLKAKYLFLPENCINCEGPNALDAAFDAFMNSNIDNIFKEGTANDLIAFIDTIFSDFGVSHTASDDQIIEIFNESAEQLDFRSYVQFTESDLHNLAHNVLAGAGLATEHNKLSLDTVFEAAKSEFDFSGEISTEGLVASVDLLFIDAGIETPDLDFVTELTTAPPGVLVFNVGPNFANRLPPSTGWDFFADLHAGLAPFGASLFIGTFDPVSSARWFNEFYDLNYSNDETISVILPFGYEDGVVGITGQRFCDKSLPWGPWGDEPCEECYLFYRVSSEGRGLVWAPIDETLVIIANEPIDGDVVPYPGAYNNFVCYKNVDLRFHEAFEHLWTKGALAPLPQDVQDTVLHRTYENGPHYITSDGEAYLLIAEGIFKAITEDYPSGFEHDVLGRFAFETPLFLKFIAATVVVSEIRATHVGDWEIDFETILNGIYDSSISHGYLDAGAYQSAIPWLLNNYSESATTILIKGIVYTVLDRAGVTSFQTLQECFERVANNDFKFTDETVVKDVVNYLRVVIPADAADLSSPDLIQNSAVRGYIMKLVIIGNSGQEDSCNGIGCFQWHPSGFAAEILYTNLDWLLENEHDPRGLTSAIEEISQRHLGKIIFTRLQIQVFFRFTMEHLISNRCPTGNCWTLNESTGECEIKPDADCWGLTCGADTMNFWFRPDLLDVLADDQREGIFAADCAPVWDDANSAFSWSENIGKCMVAESNAETGDIDFIVAISRADSRQDIKIHGIDFFTADYESQISARFRCSYDSEISASSEVFNVKPGYPADASFSDKGDFTEAFSIDLYNDDEFSQAVGDVVYVGQELFVDVNWAVTEGVQFYAQSCEIDIDGQTVSLISDNCLADIFGVTNHQPGVYSNNGSYKFSYTTFTNDRDLGKTNTISCALKICLTGDQNTCAPATSCPQNEFNFVLPSRRR
ncbi:Oidioi.mRNA.OKI2018_I69.chr2.g4652.t1.cds [Oikopleura dioica]|uniref:Oidioi.mRNA.OKI2018_I69.chr2.g4652.t1.cds n=1 Tax=Oikopleura dioica TaxID=34765 RepID=A0ABN7T2A6_OIKDI|nr:Oidioi.mRNA.OKI2018_I69.chr2.g4652.t1.cds [Oikopleura dioica]